MSVVALLAAVAFILANAFFVAAEFAIMASRMSQIEAKAEAGNRLAKLALKAMRSLQLQLAGAQLGINVTSLGLGHVAEPAIASFIEPWLESTIGFDHGLSHVIGTACALAIVVFFHMVLGEMVPKNVAIAVPERLLLVLIAPYALYISLFRPIIWVLNAAAQLLARLFGVDPADEIDTAKDPEAIAEVVGAIRADGLIEDFEHDLLTGALGFDELTAGSVMIPRHQIQAVQRSATLATVEEMVRETGHSRLLVIDGDLDDAVGFVHAKDLLTLPVAGQTSPVPDARIRDLLPVAVDARLDDVLAAMQARRRHFGVVCREDDHVLGIITLEDILEELVGDIRDETDRDRARPGFRPGGTLLRTTDR